MGDGIEKDDRVRVRAFWTGSPSTWLYGKYLGIGYHNEPEVRLDSGAVVVVPWGFMEKVAG